MVINGVLAFIYIILFQFYLSLIKEGLLFQTGYLTIKSIKGDTYILDYPNREVRVSLYQHLVAGFRQASSLETQPLLANIKISLEKRNLKEFITHINTLFSSIPYQIFIEKQEAFFHAVLHITFHALGLYVQSEVSRAKGRIDTIVQTDEHVYIMEFKLDESAEAALEQIRTQRYGSSYLNQGKEIIALGINFSSKEKAVVDWQEVGYEHLMIEG